MPVSIDGEFITVGDETIACGFDLAGRPDEIRHALNVAGYNGILRPDGAWWAVHVDVELNAILASAVLDSIHAATDGVIDPVVAVAVARVDFAGVAGEFGFAHRSSE